MYSPLQVSHTQRHGLFFHSRVSQGTKHPGRPSAAPAVTVSSCCSSTGWPWSHLLNWTQPWTPHMDRFIYVILSCDLIRDQSTDIWKSESTYMSVLLTLLNSPLIKRLDSAPLFCQALLELPTNSEADRNFILRQLGTDVLLSSFSCTCWRYNVFSLYGWNLHSSLPPLLLWLTPPGVAVKSLLWRPMCL